MSTGASNAHTGNQQGKGQGEQQANQRRFYTIVVMLQPSAWEAINGDTVDGDLSSVLKQLPRPIRISSDTYEFVIIEYNEWQQRILRRQGNL